MEDSHVIERVYNKAKSNPQRIAFPEADDVKVLQAAAETASGGYGHCWLLGNVEKLKDDCLENDIDVAQFNLVDIGDEELRARLLDRYFEVSTGILGRNTLARRMETPLYFAMVMQAVGDIDVTIGGLNATTTDVIRAAIEVIGVKEDSTISSIGVFQVPGFEGSEEDMVVMADCGVCPNPDAIELASIAIDTCDTVQGLFGWTPRCAILSFSTLGSASNDLVDKVVQAVHLANERRPDLLIDGEFQVDTAIVPVVAAKKVKRESAVAGKANILIFPDLNAGNIGGKLVQVFAKAIAVGPILQGFNRIVTDSSRGASVSELVRNIVISGVRAAALKE